MQLTMYILRMRHIIDESEDILYLANRPLGSRVKVVSGSAAWDRGKAIKYILYYF